MKRWGRCLLAVAALLPAIAFTAQPAPSFGVYVAPDGQVLDTEWHLPAGDIRALVVLQHGFARRCANLRTLARTLAAEGGATLCINAEMARGAPALAGALARDLAADLVEGRAGALGWPAGRPLPSRVIAAGHSAGGLFAAHLAAAMSSLAPRHLAGVLLFDPVGGADLAAALGEARASTATPVLAVLAPPSRCNARQLARPALETVAATIVELADGTHVDAEAEDTEAIAVWACREGAPREAAVRRLRAEAAGFVGAAAGGPVSAGASEPQRQP